MHTWETPHSPGAGEKQITYHYKTLKQVQQAISILKNNQYITLHKSRVEYNPSHVATWLSNFKPYRLTIWYKENHG